MLRASIGLTSAPPIVGCIWRLLGEVDSSRRPSTVICVGCSTSMTCCVVAICLPRCNQRSGSAAAVADERSGQGRQIHALRHQVVVPHRHLHGDRVKFSPTDRAWLAALLHPLPRTALNRRAQRGPDTPNELDHGTLDLGLPPRATRPDSGLQPGPSAVRRSEYERHHNTHPDPTRLRTHRRGRLGDSSTNTIKQPDQHG